MNVQRRSNCPISFSLDIVGDAWSLLIIRDIVFAGKKTYGEFIESEEGIARNILANRLSRLEKLGVIAKKPHPDGRKDLYELTEAGLDFIPVLLELSAWGAKYEPETAETIASLNEINIDKVALIKLIQDTVRQGGSVFVGPGSVMEQLNLNDVPTFDNNPTND